MEHMVAGPWVGEFGWELMSWQAWLRAWSKHYQITVCSYSTSRSLYADFCESFIGLPDLGGTRDCWRLGGNFQADPLKEAEQTLDRLPGERVRPTRLLPTHKQSFIQFGTPKEPRFDVVVHARGAVGKCAANRWPASKWEQLVYLLQEAGLKVACIGTAVDQPAGHDFRGIPLQETMDLLASTRLAVGVASGPMHLASLCGTPHLVWTDKRHWAAIGGTNLMRFTHIWNPRTTPCRVLECGWDPPEDLIFRNIQELLAKGSHRV